MRYIITAIWCVIFAIGAASMAVAQADYRVKPGDSLAVEVLEDPSLNRSVLVLPGGTINFPFAGTLTVAGRTVLEVQQAITAGIASNFAAQPTVFVSVNAVTPLAPTAGGVIAPLTIDIYLLGEVNSPGPKSVEPGTTFLQGMSLSGGFTNFAATKRVQLRRTATNGEQTLFTIDYRALSQGARMTNNITLLDGDVILVPERRLFE